MVPSRTIISVCWVCFFFNFYGSVPMVTLWQKEVWLPSLSLSLYISESSRLSWTPFNHLIHLIRMHQLFPISISFFVSFFFNILFIYSWETQRERQRHRQREKQVLCGEPDVGLDPGSPGSHPGLKAVLNRWATRAAPKFCFWSDNIP